MQLFEFIKKELLCDASLITLSLKILNSEHFYGTVHLISHFMVSPWMAADAISGLPFYLNWKHFSDFPNVLNSSLAKNHLQATMIKCTCSGCAWLV